MIRILFFTFLVAPFWSFSQDFYINQKTEVVRVKHIIPPEWINLNLNESYDFLDESGFTNIEKTSNGNKEIVNGEIRTEDYVYFRRLYFVNKVVTEYSDVIVFIKPCLLCLSNTMSEKLKYNPTMQGILKDQQESSLESDIELKDLFHKYHMQSLKMDGIESELNGKISDFGFSFTNSIETDDLSIIRKCKLILDEDDIYNFYSERRCVLNNQDYMVGNYDLKEVNQYDLRLMVDVFLADCKSNDIILNSGEVITSFKILDENTLGLSYGRNDDDLIMLKIDPEKWANASIPKRWYLIYHELGHDVLNLEHGNGGEMMFNFADRGYSWKEFWEDRIYMLESYKKFKK
jgi:hypothetical protein